MLLLLHDPYCCALYILSTFYNKGNYSKHKKIAFYPGRKKPEYHWSCIAHLSAEDMLKSAVIEEKKFKHSPRVGADNPLRPKF